LQSDPTPQPFHETLDVDHKSKSRSLVSACLAHLLHDGYTDQLYALLPVWQSQFGLSYAGLAVVRALYYGTMGGLQVPGERLMVKLVSPAALALATFLAAAGYLVMALPWGISVPVRWARHSRHRIERAASASVAAHHKCLLIEAQTRLFMTLTMTDHFHHDLKEVLAIHKPIAEAISKGDARRAAGLASSHNERDGRDLINAISPPVSQETARYSLPRATKAG
jgi:hypothetical protein